MIVNDLGLLLLSGVELGTREGSIIGGSFSFSIVKIVTWRGEDMGLLSLILLCPQVILIVFFFLNLIHGPRVKELLYGPGYGIRL